MVSLVYYVGSEECLGLVGWFTGCFGLLLVGYVDRLWDVCSLLILLLFVLIL